MSTKKLRMLKNSILLGLLQYGKREGEKMC